MNEETKAFILSRIDEIAKEQNTTGFKVEVHLACVDEDKPTQRYAHLHFVDLPHSAEAVVETYSQIVDYASNMGDLVELLKDMLGVSGVSA